MKLNEIQKRKKLNLDYLKSARLPITNLNYIVMKLL